MKYKKFHLVSTGALNASTLFKRWPLWEYPLLPRLCSPLSRQLLSRARSYTAHRDVPVPSLPLTVDTNDEQPRVRQQAVGRRWTLLARRTRGDRWRSGGTQRVTCSSQVHWWSTVRQEDRYSRTYCNKECLSSYNHCTCSFYTSTDLSRTQDLLELPRFLQ